VLASQLDYRFMLAFLLSIVHLPHRHRGLALPGMACEIS
jgi:hypothetical protein